MKRKVIIVLEIDPTEYEGENDSPVGAINLAADMCRQLADFPETAQFTCEESTLIVDLTNDDPIENE